MKRLGPLQFALDFEMKGTALYLKLAKSTKNLLAKRLFYSLASQEVQHAKRADETYQALEENRGWDLGVSKDLPKVESELKEFFSKAKSADFKKDADNLKGYDLAMDMERKGYNAYKNFHANAKTELEKEFFESMMKEEKDHLDSLQNVYYYLTKSGDWFEDEESRIWNWMNL